MSGWLVDPEAVANEYASEEALRERWAAYDELLEGPNEDEILKELARQGDSLPREGAQIDDAGLRERAGMFPGCRRPA